jgi:hypothetical protein
VKAGSMPRLPCPAMLSRDAANLRELMLNELVFVRDHLAKLLPQRQIRVANGRPQTVVDHGDQVRFDSRALA